MTLAAKWVKLDRDGWRAESTNEGLGSIEASYMVAVPTAYESAAVRLSDAMIAASVAEGVPQPNELLDTGHVVGDHSITMRAKGPDLYIFRVSMRLHSYFDHPEAPKVTIRSNMQTTEDYRDSGGNLLLVSYTPSGGSPQSSLSAVQRMIPTGELQIEGVYNPPGSVSDVVLAWTGYTNARAFVGFGPGVLYCQSVEASPWKGSAQKWQIRFSFLFNQAGTWDELIYYRDANDEVPQDAEIGNGARLAQLYNSQDFNAVFPYAPPVPGGYWQWL